MLLGTALGEVKCFWIWLTSAFCVCVCTMCEEWVYEAQREVLNRNNAGSSFSLSPRLLCVWLLPTWIAEEVHVNSMADLTAAQPQWVWNPGTVEQKWWHFLVFLLFRGWGGDQGSLFPTPVLARAGMGTLGSGGPTSFPKLPLSGECHWFVLPGGHEGVTNHPTGTGGDHRAPKAAPLRILMHLCAAGAVWGLVPLQSRSAGNDAARSGRGGK